MKKTIINIILLVLSYMILMAISYISGLYSNKFYSSGILSILVYILIVYIILNYLKKFKDKKTTIFFSIISLFISTTLVYGYNLDTKETIGIIYPITHIYIVLLSIFIYSVFNFIISNFKKVYKAIDNKISFKFLDKFLFDKHTYLKSFILILLAWLPIYLAFFPGIFSYDAPYQFSDIYYWVFRSGNPIIHTLLVGGCLNLGKIVFSNYNYGLMIYSISQMIILASVLAYVIHYIDKRNINKYIKIISLLIFMFLPTHVLLSMTPTKDVLFSCFVILLFIKLIDMVSYKDEFYDKKNIVKNIILTILYSFLMMIFRPNGLYGFVFVSIFLLIYNRKKLITTLIIILIPLCLYKGYGYLTSYLPQGTNKFEGMPPVYIVPVQQLARTYNYANLTKKEKQELDSVFTKNKHKHPLKEYRKHIYDPVSRNMDKGIMKHNIEDLRKVYIKYLFKYPNIYLDAFFDNSLSYWYLVDKYPDNSYYNLYRPYLEVYTEDRDYHTDNQIKNSSKIPILYKYYRSMVENGKFQSVPILSLLMNNALYNLLLIILFVFSLFKKKKETIPLLLLIGLIGTNFLGPVALTRYCYYLYIGLPILIMLFVNKDKESNKN